MKKLPHDENEIIENMKFRGKGHIQDGATVYFYSKSHPDPDIARQLEECGKRQVRRGRGEFEDGSLLDKIFRRKRAAGK